MASLGLNELKRSVSGVYKWLLGFDSQQFTVHWKVASDDKVFNKLYVRDIVRKVFMVSNVVPIVLWVNHIIA